MNIKPAIQSFIIIIFLLSTTCVMAQEVVTSIENEYNKTTQNTPERFTLAGKYAQTLFYNGQKEKAFKILRQNIAFAEKFNDSKHASYLYAVSAINYQLEKNEKASDNSIYKAVHYAEKTQDYSAKGFVKYAQGWIKLRKSKEAEAVKFFLDALKLYDKAPSNAILLSRLSSVYSELTSIYANWNDYPLQEKYNLEENLEEIKIDYKDVTTLLGKENKSYYLLFHYKKGLNFLKVNSNYELKIENNKLKFSKNNQLIYSFEYAIINQDLVIYLPNKLKKALSIVQYQPLHQNLDEEVKLKYVSLYSIEDFELSLKEPILPIEFKMLISSVSSEKLIESKDISIAFIHHLLKNKKYTFAKYTFNNYYSEEKKQSYLNQNKTINNLLFYAVDNNDIDLLSKIPEQYLSKLFETEDGLKLNSLGYAIIKMKPEMVKYLSKKMNDGMICIQDDKENKNYRFNEALQLVADKDQFTVYLESVIKTMPYVVTD